MKEKYTAPEMEIIEFEYEDVIISSGPEGVNQTPVVTPIPDMVPYPDPTPDP